MANVTAPLWSSCAFLLFHLSNHILLTGDWRWVLFPLLLQVANFCKITSVFAFQIKEWFQFNMLQAHLLVINNIDDNKSSTKYWACFWSRGCFRFSRELATVIIICLITADLAPVGGALIKINPSLILINDNKSSTKYWACFWSRGCFRFSRELATDYNLFNHCRFSASGGERLLKLILQNPYFSLQTEASWIEFPLLWNYELNFEWVW